MKKTITLFLLTCLTAMLFTACGGTHREPEANNTIPPLRAADTAEPSATPEPVQSPEVTPAGSAAPGAPGLAEGGVMAATFEELQAAVQDTEVTAIHIASAVEITEELSFERDCLTIYIDPEGTLTVGAGFYPVACGIVNDGAILVNSEFERGICNFTNNGTVTVKDGGVFSSGMSDTENTGSFTVETGGTLSIDRGSAFNNAGTLTSKGHITVDDGGQLNDAGGTIINDGTFDLNAYFNGDISLITGTGTINDNRE